MKVSLDTNILIDTPQIVFDKDRDFVLSFTVIRELDNLKRNPDLKRAAQAAIRNIWIMFKKDEIEILNIPDLLGQSPDEKIIQDTKDAGAGILSNDIAVRIIAKAHGVDISEFEIESDLDYEYNGWIKIPGDIDYEKNFVQIKEMQLAEFEETFNVKMKHNQYCIIDRVVEKDDIWKRKEDTVIRISQSNKPFGAAKIGISPMDSEQMCALDAVFDLDVPLTVLDGTLGTGKTLMSLMGALGHTVGERRYESFDEILVTKPPVSINKQMYTGYKPGTSEEKMSGHLGGIKSNLKFMLDKRDYKKKKGERNLEEARTNAEKVWDDYFGVVEIDEIQGTSLHNTCLIVDEYQLLDTDSLKLVLSRISEGSKVILVGDVWGQTYGMNRSDEGFKTLYKHLGENTVFNYVRLFEIYRSPLAKFIDEVFD